MSHTSDFEKVVQENIRLLLSHEINKEQCVAGMMYLIRQASSISLLPDHNRLKDLRKKLNLSLRDVSAKTGVPISTISRMENGSNVEYKNIMKIHDYLRQQPTV